MQLQHTICACTRAFELVVCHIKLKLENIFYLGCFILDWVFFNHYYSYSRYHLHQ